MSAAPPSSTCMDYDFTNAMLDRRTIDPVQRILLCLELLSGDDSAACQLWVM